MGIPDHSGTRMQYSSARHEHQHHHEHVDTADWIPCDNRHPGLRSWDGACQTGEEGLGPVPTILKRKDLILHLHYCQEYVNILLQEYNSQEN